MTFTEEDGSIDTHASADEALDAFDNGAVVCLWVQIICITFYVDNSSTSHWKNHKLMECFHSTASNFSRNSCSFLTM